MADDDLVSRIVQEVMDERFGPRRPRVTQRDVHDLVRGAEALLRAAAASAPQDTVD